MSTPELRWSAPILKYGRRRLSFFVQFTGGFPFGCPAIFSKTLGDFRRCCLLRSAKIASVRRQSPAYAVWDVVHVDLSGGFDVFMAQDSLSVFHSAVLLEVGAQCATEDLETCRASGESQARP
jgi:hypothetical protein